MLLVVAPAAMTFFLTISISLFLAFSCQSVFILWALMEASIVLFIGLIACEPAFSPSAAAKFFLPQSFLGLGLFFLLSTGAWVPVWVSNPMLTGVLLCKLGMAPFHFWVPGVVKNLSQKMLFVFLSPQKVFPLILVGWSMGDSGVGYFLIGVASLVSSVFVHSYSSFNELMTFSSMVSTGWVLSLSGFWGSGGMVCFGLYSLLLAGVLVSVGYSNSGSFSVGMAVLFLTMLSGAPPGPVFTLKWVFLSAWIAMGQGVVLPCLLLVSSTCMIPVYLKLVCSVLYRESGETWGKEGSGIGFVLMGAGMALFLYPALLL